MKIGMKTGYRIGIMVEVKEWRVRGRIFHTNVAGFFSVVVSLPP